MNRIKMIFSKKNPLIDERLKPIRTDQDRLNDAVKELEISSDDLAQPRTTLDMLKMQ